MKERRLGKPNVPGEVPPPEVPGQVFIPIPGLKPGDKDAEEKIVSELLPGKEKAGWFKDLSKKGKIGLVVGGAMVIVGVVEHMRGYRDLDEIREKVKEAKDKWVDERLPKLKNFRKEYDKKEQLRLKSIKEFMKKAPLYSQAEVSPVFLSHFDKDNKKRMVTFGIKYALPSNDFYIEYLSPNISEEDWNDLSMQREIERRLSAQAEKQRRIVRDLLKGPDEQVILTISDKVIPKEVRDEIVEHGSYSNDSVLDSTFINPPAKPPLKPRRFNLFRRGK